MNLLADEGVDRQIVDRLRHEGYSVLYVAEMDPGLADELVLDRANRAQALLLTVDKDFGELVFRQLKLTSGVILFTFGRFATAAKGRDSHCGLQGALYRFYGCLLGNHLKKHSNSPRGYAVILSSPAPMSDYWSRIHSPMRTDLHHVDSQSL